MKSIFLGAVLLVSLAISNLKAQCVSGNCTSGLGTYVWDSGDEYTGQWVDGGRTGLGVYDWKDGSYYYGYFKDGKLEGKGVYLGNDDAKTTLIGYFHDGTLSEKNNFIETGCILGNCNYGVGAYLWDSDDIYMGEWSNGNRTGYGRYDWKDGSFYTGYFKDGKLDGRGYYQGTDDKKMDGYFENNNFVSSASSSSSTTTAGEASKPNGDGSSSTSYSVETYDDVCSLLRTVIKSFPDEYSSVKGAKDEDSYLLTFWASTVKLSGASDEAELSSGILDLNKPSLWSEKIYKSESFSSAKAKYDDYVSQFKSCNNSCCMFSSSTDHKTKDEETYTTSFKTSSVNGGFSSDYNELEVVFELQNDSYSKQWELEIQVWDNSEY